MTASTITCSPDPIIKHHATTNEAMAVAADLEGRRWVARVVDVQGRWHKDMLLDAIAKAFSFPTYFGRNWDALADCWADMHWLPADGYACFIVDSKHLEQDDLQMLEDIAWDVGGRARFRLILS